MVPLSIRDHTSGQIILASATPAGCFRPRDLETALELGHRVALGVENVRLYQQAQEAVRVRDEFLTIASHELRTPLTPLQIHFQRLLRRRPDDLLTAPDQLRRVLERCERQVRRLEALVDNLLDVSRQEQRDRAALEFSRLDLAEIVRDVCGRFAEELTAAECSLSLRVESSVIGRWDKLRLEQIVTNILSNAIKYGGGKPIEVTLEGTPATGRLTIRDHGIGINSRDLNRIFRRFQRAVSFRSYGGLGLGLYITRQVVDAHAGTIRVESNPGVGSAFVVELPRSTSLLLGRAMRSSASDWNTS